MHNRSLKMKNITCGPFITSFIKNNKSKGLHNIDPYPKASDYIPHQQVPQY